MPITLNLLQGNPNCAGLCNGQILITAVGGQAPYTFTLRPGGTSNTTGVFTGLCVGNYIIDVIDSLGETATIPLTIFEANPITCTIATLGTTATITASGGTAPYEYSLDGSPFQLSGTFNNLLFGTHTVTIRDDGGCTKSTAFELNPDESYGFMTSNIFIYDNPGTFYQQGCLGDVTCGQRVKICFDMSIPGYNFNILNNGGAGDFATNLVGIGTILTDTPVTDLDNYTVSQDVPITLETDNSGGCVEFRVPDDWTGINYFYAVYQFEITLPNKYTYIDNIFYPVVLNVIEKDDGTNFSAELQDLNGNPIDDICDNPTAPDMKVCFSSVLPFDFDVHYLLTQNGEVTGEEDPYSHIMLEQLDELALSNGDASLTAGDEACVTIDTDKLPFGDYCIKAIFKSQGAPTSDPCPCIEMEITRTIDPFNTSGASSGEIEYTVLGLTDADIASVLIIQDPKPGIVGIGTLANQTFNYVACVSPLEDIMNGVITTTDGCVYYYDDINFGVPVAGAVTMNTGLLGQCCGSWEIQSVDNGDGTWTLTAVDIGTGCLPSVIFWFGAGTTNQNPIIVNAPGTYQVGITCTDFCFYQASVTIP